MLWSTEEFGFAVFDDAFATGSSMLPQKKNPDVAELARGKSGRLIGNLTGLMVTLKGLPLAYNRDLQEDKEPLFDSVAQTHLALAALSGVMSTLRFVTERMEEAANGSAVAAVDLAEWLVQQGMPFRQAHTVVGGLVGESLDRHVPLAELVAAHPDLGAEAVALLESWCGRDPPDDPRRGRTGGRRPSDGPVRRPSQDRSDPPGRRRNAPRRGEGLHRRGSPRRRWTLLPGPVAGDAVPVCTHGRLIR